MSKSNIPNVPRLNSDQFSKKTGEFNYETIIAGYYDYVFRKRCGIQSKWHHLKFSHVCSCMKNYQSHLDIGCGAGTFIGLLNKNKTSVGVDIACEQIAYAQANYGHSNHQFFLIEPGVKLPFEDASFEIVTLIEVIEHLRIEEAKFLLKESYRLLQPGGQVLITTPNYASLWLVVEFILNRISPVSYREQHISHYTKHRLRNLLQEGGFHDPVVSAFQLIAPFAVIFGWRFSDIINRFEPSFLVHLFGLLLMGEARK